MHFVAPASRRVGLTTSTRARVSLQDHEVLQGPSFIVPIEYLLYDSSLQINILDGVKMQFLKL